MFTVLDVTQAIGRQAAATAAHAGVDLVTRNLKHYPMTDIRVSVPYERGSP